MDTQNQQKRETRIIPIPALRYGELAIRAQKLGVDISTWLLFEAKNRQEETSRPVNVVRPVTATSSTTGDPAVPDPVVVTDEEFTI